MKPNFDYDSVPYGFIHCFHAQCKHASQCLRHQVALRISPERDVISVVSPTFKPPVEASCPYFKMA